MWFKRVSPALLVFGLFLVIAKAQEVYNICANSTTNVVRINANSSPIVIQSPNFESGLYGNSRKCTLSLWSDTEPLIFFLHHNTFNLEYHNVCAWDSLCVHGVKFCGDWSAGETFEYYIQENSTFTLTFSTDSSITAPGFQINVTAERAVNQTFPEATSGFGSNASNINYTTVTYTSGLPYNDRCALLDSYPDTNPSDTQTSYTDYGQSSSPLASNLSEYLNTTQKVYYFCDNSTSNIFDITDTSSPLVIRSPNFGTGQYINNLLCAITFRSSQEPVVVIVEFNYFEVESQAGCIWDSLCINGIKFCGYWKAGHSNSYLLPENSTFTIQFKTDGLVAQAGFQINVTAVSAINQTITEASGGVGSSPGEINYTTVTYQPGRTYTDRCASQADNSSDIESTSYPYYDVLYNSSNSYPNSFYNESTTYPYYNDTSLLPPLLNASMDLNKTQEVFNFCDGSPVININATSPAFLLRSPDFGLAPYPNDLVCRVVFVSGSQPLILHFVYDYFDVEDDEHCLYDALCVHGIEFCGDWETGQNYLFILKENSTFTLVFKTDSSVTEAGFQMSVSAELAVNNTVVEVAEGEGSKASNIHSRTVTFQPGLPYTDRCANLGYNPFTNQSTSYFSDNSSTNQSTSYYSDNSTTNQSTSYFSDNSTTNQSTSYFSDNSSTNQSTSYFSDNSTTNQSTSYFSGNSSTNQPTVYPGFIASTNQTEPDIFIDLNTTQQVYYFCETNSSVDISIDTASPPVFIRSPNYGETHYENSLSCFVKFRSGNEPLIVNFVFDHFDVEYHAGCIWDSLCINGIKFCGDWEAFHSNAFILPENSNFTIRFTTDGSVTKPGFEITVATEPAANKTIDEAIGGVGSNSSRLQYTPITYHPGLPYSDRCTQKVYSFCENSPVSVINIDAASPPFLIRSAGFGLTHYGNDLSCSVQLRSGNVPLVVKLEYNNFDVEYQLGCAWDSVCINGIKFCGNWEAGHSNAFILPENSIFTISFRTDGTVTKPGFQITVSTERAVDQTISEATGGVGSNPSSVKYAKVTYKSDHPYTDRCAAYYLYDNSSTGYPYYNGSSNYPYYNGSSNYPYYNGSTSFPYYNESTSYPYYNESDNSSTKYPYYNESTSYPSYNGSDNSSIIYAWYNSSTSSLVSNKTVDLNTTQPVVYICDKSSSLVKINDDSPDVVIRSPNFGTEQYGNNQHCAMALQSGNEPLVVTVVFNYFDLEPNDKCAYDLLCAQGVKFCGNWESGYQYSFILPPNETSTFDFRTDSSFNYEGFQITVRTEQAFNQTIQEISGGVGSSKDRITNTTAIYTPGFAYTDGCKDQQRVS